MEGRTGSALTALAVCAALVAGCGGDDDDGDGGNPEEQAIRATFERYYEGIGTDRFDQACAQLTDQVRAEVTSQARGADCPTAVAAGFKELPLSQSGNLKLALREAQVTRVVITGTTAKATVRLVINGADQRGDILARKVDGAWKVAQLVDTSEPEPARGGGAATTTTPTP